MLPELLMKYLTEKLDKTLTGDVDPIWHELINGITCVIYMHALGLFIHIFVT